MKSTEIAETYFDRIGEGHKNAVHRPSDSRVDRAFRKLVEKANDSGDCIISGDCGYYRPVPEDPLDSLEYHVYMAKERSRELAIDFKVGKMVDAYLERANNEQ